MALSRYNLCCGYVQVHEEKGIRLTMWHEHNTYHVRAHNHTEHVRLFWDVFETLTDARKRFSRAKKELF